MTTVQHVLVARSRPFVPWAPASPDQRLRVAVSGHASIPVSGRDGATTDVVLRIATAILQPGVLEE
jgi:hypothetical protein